MHEPAPTRSSHLGAILRAVLAAFVAIAVAAGAIVAAPILDDRPPVVSATGYDPSNPFEWDDDWDAAKWYQRSEIGVYALSEVAGAYWKDLADAKQVGGLSIRPDFAKYVTAAAFVVALLVVEIILDLALDNPSFESLLADRVGALYERVGYLEAGVDALEGALDTIISSVVETRFRLRHLDTLANGTGNVDTYYEQFTDILDAIDEDPESAPQGLALDMFFQNVMDPEFGVPSDWSKLQSMLVGANPLIDDFAGQLAEVPWAFDDRIRYAALFDYTAYWHAMLHQAKELMLEGYNYELANSDPGNWPTIEEDIDRLLADYNDAVRKMWEPVGHPLTDDTVYTLGDRLMQRNLDVAVDDVHLLGHEWADTIDMETWDALVDLAQYGDGETMQEQLASLDVHVPEIVMVDEECTDTWTLNFDSNAAYGSKFDVTGSCTWMGFTGEDYEVHNNFSWRIYTGWPRIFLDEVGAWHIHDDQRIYEGGQAHPVHEFHQVSAKFDYRNKGVKVTATDLPNAEINQGGAYGTIDPQGWDDLVALADTGDGATMRERLASIGTDVPVTIAIDAPCEDSYVLRMRANFLGGVDRDISGDCTLVGFTEDYEVHNNFSEIVYYLGAEVDDVSMWHRDDAQRRYAGGEIHAVHNFHIDSWYGGSSSKPDYRNKGERIEPTVLAPQIVYGGPWTSWYGWAARPSNSWSMLGTGDATLDVYEDGVLIQSVTEDQIITPGLVTELTLTTDTGDIPAEGWAVYAHDPRGGEVSFAGLHHGDGTATYDLAQGAHHKIHASVVTPPIVDSIGVEVSDGGVVIVGRDGRIVDVLEAGSHTVDVPELYGDVVLTTDIGNIAQNSVVLVASADDDVDFGGWTGSYFGTADRTIPIMPGSPLHLGAVFGEDEVTHLVIDDAASTVVGMLPFGLNMSTEEFRPGVEEWSGVIQSSGASSSLAEPLVVSGTFSDIIDGTTTVEVDHLSYQVNSFGDAYDVEVSGTWEYSWTDHWGTKQGSLSDADVTVLDGGQRIELVVRAGTAPVAELELVRGTEAEVTWTTDGGGKVELHQRGVVNDVGIDGSLLTMEESIRLAEPGGDPGLGVGLVPVADDGHAFVRWNDAGVSLPTPGGVELDGTLDLVAEFIPAISDVVGHPGEHGTFEVWEAGAATSTIVGGHEASVTLDAGDVLFTSDADAAAAAPVAVLAVADDGFEFAGWTMGRSGLDDATVKLVPGSKFFIGADFAESEPEDEPPNGDDQQVIVGISADSSRVGAVLHGAQPPHTVSGSVAVDGDRGAIHDGPLLASSTVHLPTWTDDYRLQVDTLEFEIGPDGDIIATTLDGVLHVDEGTPRQFALTGVSGNYTDDRLRLVFSADGNAKDSTLVFHADVP
ncbi:MAG: hypothetical protein AAGF73_00555 [Actinomycetota bacterium]